VGEKHPVLSPREIIRKLESFGFEYKSQKGSHIKYVKESAPARVVIIPNHDTVARGTLRSILEQANITLEEFLKK